MRAWGSEDAVHAHKTCGLRDGTADGNVLCCVGPYGGVAEAGGKKGKGKKKAPKRKLRPLGADRRGPKTFARLLEEVGWTACLSAHRHRPLSARDVSSYARLDTDLYFACPRLAMPTG